MVVVSPFALYHREGQILAALVATVVTVVRQRESSGEERTEVRRTHGTAHDEGMRGEGQGGKTLAKRGPRGGGGEQPTVSQNGPF